MILSIQIYSLLFSFLYGIIFHILLEINYKFLYNDNLILKIIYTTIFIIFNTLLYFICIKKINNGIIHIYFLLSILAGYLVSKLLLKKLRIKKGLHFSEK